MNETIENNKLIAEFMSDWRAKTWLNGRVHEMKYHSSWDWLMPVVEKIWGIIGNRASLWHFDVSEIAGEEMFISNNREYDGNNRADCYSAVLEFIKWYNSNSVS